jgi:integrase
VSCLFVLLVGIQQCAEEGSPVLRLVLDATSNKAYIVYLTGGKTTRVALPPRLTDLIKSSLEHNPREHLFTYSTARSGHEPSPYTARSFSAWCAKVVRDATNNPAASLKLCLQAFIT